jgi:hypothetical protein
MRTCTFLVLHCLICELEIGKKSRYLIEMLGGLGDIVYPTGLRGVSDSNEGSINIS